MQPIKNSIYTIERIVAEDGTVTIRRINDGFHSVELLGYLTMAQKDVMDQIQGIFKPDVITRTAIVDEPSTKESI